MAKKKTIAKKKGLKEKNPLAYKAIRWGAIGVVSAMLLVVLLYFAVYIGVFGKLPNKDALQNIKNYTASRVFTSDGEVLGKYFIQNRTNVSYDEISPNIINALVATEDARFYKHEGVDSRSLVRVFFKTLLAGDESSGGGSTITQQLAKNLFPRKNYSFLSMPVNKFKEAIIAARLEDVYTKEEILTLYLNTVPFSGNIFGIETATKNIFGKEPQDVKLEEAAVIVGMLKANTTYNPVINPEKSVQRRNTVLQQMVKYDYLEQEVADSLKQLEIKLNYKVDSHNEGLGTYFREHLRNELDNFLEDYKKKDGSSYNLYRDGLKIYTTIDSRMQKYAEESVQEHMAHLQKTFNNHLKYVKLNKDVVETAKKKSSRYLAMKDDGLSEAEIDQQFNEKKETEVWTWDGEVIEEMSALDSIRHYASFLNTAFMAMEPGSGHVKAWVGGINHKYFQYNHITAQRQVGSTFKPIVYAAAIEQGIEPCDYFPNQLISYAEYKDWTPQNADNSYGGYYSMQGALTNSVNTVSVQLIMETGINQVIALARQMGIAGNIPRVPSIALGVADLSLMEMIKAYAVFPNRGVTTTPVYLLRIEDSEGNVIADFNKKKNKNQRVLSTETADIMNQMLSGVVNYGTAARLRNVYKLSGDIAGKTGTTQSQADGWFIGYTPNLVAGAWVGADDRRVRFSSLSLGQGANTALPIWGKFMVKINRDGDLRKYRSGGFVSPDSLAMERLNCAPYIEEEPSFWDTLFSNDEEPFEMHEREERPVRRRQPTYRKNDESIFDKIKDIFKKD